MARKLQTLFEATDDDLKAKPADYVPLQTKVKTADDDAMTNPSDNPPFQAVLQRYLSRRDVLRGGLGGVAAYVMGMPLMGFAADGGNSAGALARVHNSPAAGLGFESIAGSLADKVRVPEGYRVQVFIPWGTPINGVSPEFDAVNASHTAAEQAQQTGCHHDGLYFFPLPRGSESSAHGLYCVNHENISQQYVHPNGPTLDENGSRKNSDEVRKEINCHGVSVLEILRDGAGQWVIADSGFNRRITGATAMQLTGPVAATEFVQTRYSPDGMFGRGTLNNCAMGFTPWGTYLTCEENWAGYFVNKAEDPPREHSRYGVPSESSNYNWHTAAGLASEVNGEFARFNATPAATSAAEDYRNEPNQFGWVVEVDPYNPSAIPVKRTALGRMGHEGCWIGKIEKGKQLAFYMGDDSRFEYIYKFVTRQAYDPDTAGGFLLDNGTLYVARFNDDGAGEWLALDESNGKLIREFGDLAGILVNTRSAADLLGATPMDRPEWGAVDQVSGEVYMTLTNNTDRGNSEVDSNFAEQAAGEDIGATPPNPRAPNEYGHIIRWREDGDDPAATTFVWDIFVFGAPADAPAEVNRSGLTEKNQFASPDGLWVDARGIIWIQTDDGSDVREETNNQMLAVVPANLNGEGVTPENQAELRRFLTGPVGCEITGVHTTPDGRNMFVNIQHPGEDGTPEDPTSAFPSGPGTRPRSATVIITREDGGIIGL